MAHATTTLKIAAGMTMRTSNYVLIFVTLVFAIRAQAALNVENRLINAKWDTQAARAVVQLNQTAFEILEQENPEGFNRTVQWLERLGKEPGLMLMLRRHPELASLLATAHDPWIIKANFEDDECFGATAGFYQFISGFREQSALSDALQRHGSLICDMSARGFPAPFTVFMFNGNAPGAAEYGRWLNEALRQSMSAQKSASPSSSERLAETMSYVTGYGTQIRHRMARDKDFERTFRTTLWPAFRRVTDCTRKPKGMCDTSFEILADEPLVWDLLMQNDGEQLLDRWGPLAVLLLIDGEEFPAVMRPRAREAMHDSDEQMIEFLLRFKDEPLFQQAMLRKELTPSLRQQILYDLNKACPSPGQYCSNLNFRLQQYVRLKPAILADELGPPPTGPQTWLPLYSTYYLVKKIAQGRSVDKMDIAFAAMDVFSVVFIVGKGGKLVMQKIPKGGTFSSRSIDIATERARGKLGPIGTEQLAALRPQGNTIAYAKQYFQQIENASDLARQSTTSLSVIEITKPVQWAFDKSGVGRESVKRWTGLEARVFMRRDAKLVIDPGQGPLGGFLQETAMAALVVGSVEVAEAAWKKYVSAWWLSQVQTR